MNNAYIKNGKFYIDNKVEFLVCADYPYYRDDKKNWEDRLVKLKDGGVNVVTAYIPWRHHQLIENGNLVFDFEGKTKSNTDLLEFINICNKVGLYLSLKPGPFIHAEVDFGGLPDYINPTINSNIEPMINIDGNTFKYESNERNNYVLPAPFCDEFLKHAKDWYSAVGRTIVNYIYPKGNIIAIQLLNEGVFSNANCYIENADCSKSSLKVYHEYLLGKYVSINQYNKIHKTQYNDITDVMPPKQIKNKFDKRDDLLGYHDWVEFQTFYLNKLYSIFKGFINLDVLFLANINSPLKSDRGLNTWVGKIHPEIFDGVSFGYTSWIGVVSHDQEAFYNYLLINKRKRGPNLEGNWGFSKLYDSKFRHPIVAYFQTILSVASGGTGYNIYTGVGTDNWDNNIDSIYEKPYPDCSPISSNGDLTNKYFVMKLLNTYLNYYGNEILESSTEKVATYAIYSPYYYMSSYDFNKDDLLRTGLYCEGQDVTALNVFQYTMRENNYDYDMLEILHSDWESISGIPCIVISGGHFMHTKVQERLVKYVQEGGTLIYIGEVPAINENLETCTILRNELFNHKCAATKYNEVLDDFNECVTFVNDIEVCDGEILYTHNLKPYAYKKKNKKGHAIYVGAGIFNVNQNQASKLLSNIINSLVVSYDICAECKETQVWCYQNENSTKHIFILSCSEVCKEHIIKIKNESQQYDTLKILLPTKSAAIIRVSNGAVTSFVAKGIDELNRKNICIEIEYKDFVYKANVEKDVLFIDGQEVSEELELPSLVV